jgi:hypothetical protein
MDSSWFEQAVQRVGASQADLGRYLRLAPSAVSRMFKGERQMRLLEAVQVAAFLLLRQRLNGLGLFAPDIVTPSPHP